MSVLGAIAAAVGSTALSSSEGAMGYGINKLFGVHKDAERRQLEQQDKLNALSFQWNKRQMDYAQDLEKQMYQFTFDMNKPEAIKNLIKEAGLNPGLMYGNSAGVSGTSVGGAKSGGYSSQAANEAQIMESSMALTQMGLQMAKLKSEIELNESAANKNNADADLSGAKTKTEDQVRDSFIANIFYEGKLKWFESIMNDIKLTWGDFEGKKEGIDYNLYWWNDKLYGSIGIPDKLRLTLFGDELRTSIEASGALRDNHIANSALTNEKTQYLFMEIMADIAQKKASAAESKARELEALWNIGEHVNWKTILESGVDAVNTIMNLLGTAYGSGMIKGLKGLKGVGNIPTHSGHSPQPYQSPKKKTVIKYDY